MKTLTLTQPWATLVAIGAKNIETRSWYTAYRGPLAIHAAKGFPKEARRLCQYVDPFFTFLKNAGYTKPEDLPLGAIVATCELVGCDKFGPWIDFPDKQPVRWAKGKYFFVLTDQERAFGDFSIGRFGLFLGSIKRLETPIPARGALGLWDFPDL